MLADLTIIPVGGNPHTSELLGEVLRIVAGSGLRYQLTPTATCIEGTWDEITTVARRCHAHARGQCSHVVTLLRLEDDEDTGSKLTENTASVEAKAGRNFAQAPTAPPATEAMVDLTARDRRSPAVARR